MVPVSKKRGPKVSRPTHPAVPPTRNVVPLPLARSMLPPSPNGASELVSTADMHEYHNERKMEIMMLPRSPARPVNAVCATMHTVTALHRCDTNREVVITDGEPGEAVDQVPNIISCGAGQVAGSTPALLMKKPAAHELAMDVQKQAVRRNMASECFLPAVQTAASRHDHPICMPSK